MIPPSLDESWGPVFVLLGVTITASLSYLGVRLSSRASVHSSEIEATSDLFAEYRALKDEIKKEGQEREDRLEAMLSGEKRARIAFEERLAQQMDEVLLHFAIYVQWARSGARGDPPFIPDWIYQKLSVVFNGKETP